MALLEHSVGYLVLDTGVCFKGVLLGDSTQKLESQAGEVVFNTSHSGYEEMATDPSYFQQILVMTAPQQGNYGVSDKVWESKKIHIQALVCVEMQGSKRDCEWVKRLNSHNVPVLVGVDTRSLVLYLRKFGTVLGAVVRADSTQVACKKALPCIKSMKSQDSDWAFRVTRSKAHSVKGFGDGGFRIAVIDFGIKESIVQQLVKRGVGVCIFPCRVSVEDVLSFKPDGVLLSNGPGDPGCVRQAVSTVQALLGRVYIFGICMGHQILAQALGGKTYKLKFGHRGGNHPVRDNLGKIFVTSQNHGYAVESSSLPKDVEVTHTNLNDGTVEGFRSEGRGCMGIQFHPESGPGPHEGRVLFDDFIEQIKKFKNQDKKL